MIYFTRIRLFFEDNAIGMSLLYSANEIKVVGKVLYYYQMVEGSSSHSISLVKIIDRIKTSNLCLSNLERLGFIDEGNKEMVDYHYLRYSYYTIRMLGSVGTYKAKMQLKEVSRIIEPMMPNSYLKQYHPNFIATLKYLNFCYFIWKWACILKRFLK